VAEREREQQRSLPAQPPALIERLRLTVVGAAIVLLVFVQSSGSLAADTKLDLVVDPARFLRRALSLWDPTGNSGQLQDQAYGYLFPMGPFFLLGKLAGLPPWVVQRCWESALLIVAFLGIRRLAQLLGVRGFWPPVAAGLAYALAPRMLTELFSISAELLPVAVLPWVLVPLVRASTAGSPRTAALRSGVALLFAGGVNASATLAILPVPALWLLTRSRGRRRASLIRWWLLAVLLSCLWWLIPLLALGRYSPPFLNWIESAAVTTSQNSLIAVARGADHWQAYLGPNIWPAGWIYAVAPAAILATAVIAALGFAGLALRDTGHRLFLVGTLLIGFGCLTFGHAAPLAGPFAGTARQLLDGPLVAFRNIHKFDPLVRLPLAIGFGQLLAAGPRRIAGLQDRFRTMLPGRRPAGPVLAALCLGMVAAVALAPALGDHLVQQPRTIPIAGYWTQAAGWLRGHSGDGRTLVVPGAGRPVMYWGETIDEPMQAAAESPWATREIVPLGQPGYVRLLDQVESMLATGTPQPELAPLLARSGIGYLAVRADLAPTADATDIGTVLGTLRSSPGLSLVASFGPSERETGASNRVIDEGVANGIAAIQILRVGGASGPVSMQPLGNAVLANGSAEQLPNLIEAGLPPSTPVLFGAGADGLTGARTVTTDGIRRREIQFGHPGYVGATMTADQPFQLARPAHDYLPADAGALSNWQYTGIADVRASSAGSDPAAFVNRGPDHAPWYAVDGDPATGWESGSAGGAVGQWIELDLATPVRDPVVTIQFGGQPGQNPSALTVRTDTGTTTEDVIPDDQPQRLAMPSGITQSIRLTVAAMSGGGRGTAVALDTFSVAGVSPQRWLAVPGSGDPDALVFTAAAGQRSGCTAADSAGVCRSALARAGEEDDGIWRRFSQSAADSYRLSGEVTLRPGPTLNRLLDAGSAIRVTASSTANDDPRQRPGAVVDGLSETTWSAAAGDRTPTLTLRLPRPARITGLVVRTALDAPVSTPTRYRVNAGGQSWTLNPQAGRLTFPRPVQADELVLTILQSAIKVSTDSVSGSTELLPAGISQLELTGADLPEPATELVIPCGQGPVFTLDGMRLQTTVRTDVATALAGGRLTATPCGSSTVPVSASRHDLSFASSSSTLVQQLTLTRGNGLAVAAASGQAQPLHWRSSDRTVRVDAPTATLLVVHENFNAGWQAKLAGSRLTAVQVDGWQQAFLLPAGAHGVVRLTFLPQRTFRVGLWLGLVAAVALIGLACFGGMRGRGLAVEPPALRDGRPGRLLVGGGAVIAFGLLAGWAGLLLAGLLILAWWRLPVVRAGRRWLAVLAAGGVAAGGLVNAIGPSVSSHPLTDSVACQLLVLVALAALGLTVLAGVEE
jgi:arabinofuranan 3-O-arabinosyltransferase